MSIRKAISKDEKEISKLYYQLYPNFKGPKDLVFTDKTKAKCVIFVSEKNKEITGFVIGSFVCYGSSKYGYIEELYVKETHRRMGVGKQLVDRILDEFKKLGTCALFVMTEEAGVAAQALYSKMGFKKSEGMWLYTDMYNKQE